jgi:hypothetical protein
MRKIRSSSLKMYQKSVRLIINGPDANGPAMAGQNPHQGWTAQLLNKSKKFDA